MRSSRRARPLPADGGAPIAPATLEEMLSALAGLLASATDGRIDGLWLVGSYHEGRPVRTSEIDLVVALTPGSTVGTADAVRETVTHVAALARVAPRAEVVSSDTLLDDGHVHVALSSTPVYGPLTAADVAVPEAPRPFRQAARRAIALSRSLRGGARPLDVAGPPDPRGELLGYDRRRVRDPRDGRPARSLRGAVDLAGWLATAVALAHDPHPIAGRTDAIERLHTMASVMDDLAPSARVVATVVAELRDRHGYLVPTATRPRRRIATLLEAFVDAERALLATLRDRLLDDLRSIWPDDRLFAIEGLDAVGGLDGRMVRMLERATLDPEPTVAARATQAIAAAR